jgi:hypothetical protein
MRMGADAGNEMKRILGDPGNADAAAVVVEPQQALQPELEAATLQVSLHLLLCSFTLLPDSCVAGDP